MGLFGKMKYSDDVTKNVFVIPWLLLKFVNLWPESQNFLTKTYFYFMITMSIILETGQLVFFVLNVTNLTAMASTMSTLSTTFQVICKTPVIYFYSKKLTEMLIVIKKDFWPSNMMGKRVEESLNYNAKMTSWGMLFIYFVGLSFSLGFLSAPARSGTRELPFASSYPFDWHPSPLYELIYFLQCFVNECFILHGILAHDNLYLTMCLNCVAQFKLLKEVLSRIGSEDVEELNKKLDCFFENEKIPYESANSKLFYRCVKHHRKLIKMCNDLEQIFSFSVAVQLIASLIAICVSSFLITVLGLDISQLPHLFSYCIGHVIQLFIYCAAGNELTYQANTLSSYAFNSNWYEENVNCNVKKGLLVLIQRTQRQQRFTALGIADLNYSTFVKVMRLSFSFYTLLSSMTENK